MNLYFSSVFPLEDYGNFPAYADVVDSKLSNIFCNANEVSRLLRNLNTYKSPGPDHLTHRELKECTIEIDQSFCSVSNRSFLAGEVPYAWKIGNLFLSTKRGRKDCRENYRQISLTSIAYKASEKIAKDRVVNFWKAQELKPVIFLKENQLQLSCCVFSMTGLYQEINQDLLNHQMLYS